MDARARAGATPSRGMITFQEVHFVCAMKAGPRPEASYAKRGEESAKNCPQLLIVRGLSSAGIRRTR
jgi:hypothetical protein